MKWEQKYLVTLSSRHAKYNFVFQRNFLMARVKEDGCRDPFLHLAMRSNHRVLRAAVFSRCTHAHHSQSVPTGQTLEAARVNVGA